MADLKIGAGDWVVVCDGGKALILENAGDELYPDLRTKEAHEQKTPPTREQGAEGPGKVHQSVGTARSAVEQTDWQAQGERAFLEDLAGRLDAAVMAGETKAVVIVAPPRALGILRQAYSPALRAAVSAELDKDLTKLPVHEIERRLLAA